VCNPPYLPALEEFPEAGLTSTVGGTGLLEAVVRRGGEVADEVYVRFSELARREAERAADEAGVGFEQVGRRRTVPFRVQPALSVDDYTEALLDRGLEERDVGRYRLHHEVGTYRLA